MGRTPDPTDADERRQQGNQPGVYYSKSLETFQSIILPLSSANESFKQKDSFLIPSPDTFLQNVLLDCLRLMSENIFLDLGITYL